MTDQPTISAPLHGPGGLLATPGLGARRKRWGKRTKAQQIAGNLYRGDNGKFQAGGAGGPSAPKKPSAGARAPGKQTLPAVKPLQQPKGRRGRAPVKPKPAPVDAQAKRDQADAAKRQTRDQLLTEAGIDANTQGALTDARDGNTLTPANGAKLAGMGLAEQATDGSYRLTPAGRTVVDAAMRGDAGRVRDTMSAARDAAAKPAKAPKAGGGGGKAPKPVEAAKPTADEARAKKLADNRSTVRTQMASADTGLSPAGFDAFTAFADGGDLAPETAAQLAQLGLVEGTPPRLSSAGRGAITAINRGDYRDATDAIGRGVQRTTDAGAKRTAGQTRQAEIAKRRADAAAKRTQRESAAAARQAEAATRQAAADARRLAREAQQRENAFNRAPRVGKSFAVFKDARGDYRWIARSTTAYEDRDNEILSAAALDADSQRMTRTKQFGPLRWWHVGQPDPLSDTAPWGPGLDLGWCDYSALIGRTRVESGIFTDPAIAAKVAKVADTLELSPGFFHPLDQPSAGVFSDMRTFERSLVPMRYGRASNKFTGLTVKETRMDIDEMERRFKTVVAELGLDKEQATALGKQLVQTEKDAAAQGVAFKATDANPTEITLNGVVYTVKAALPPEALEVKAPESPAAMVEAGATEIEDAIDEVADEPEGNFIGDMDVEAFKAMMIELLAPNLKTQELHKAVGDMVSELKSMYSGVATKETAELTALKAQMAQIAGAIAQIEGNQPATILPDDVAAALKSTGPSAPESDPNAVVVPNDPNRPFAALGAATMPELYREYGPNGWVKQS